MARVHIVPACDLQPVFDRGMTALDLPQCMARQVSKGAPVSVP